MFLCGFFYFVAFFTKKKPYERKIDFLQKPWTNPLQNVHFFKFFRTSLLRSKKHPSLSRIWKNYFFLAFFGQKKKWEKGRFFDKNHGLTPLHTVHFFEFFRTSLFRSKKHSFHPEYQKMSLSGFFWSKKKMRKRSIFWQKPWTNPFAKCRFFRVF